MSKDTLTQMPYQMAQLIVNNHNSDYHRIQQFETGDRHADVVHEFVVIDGHGLYFCDHPTDSIPSVFGYPPEVEKHFEKQVAASE